MADKQLRLVLLGDATSVQKALRTLDAELAGTQAAVKSTGDTITKQQKSTEDFGKAFQKLAAQIGIALLIKEAAQGVADYTKKIQESSAQIVGVTKSQAALNQAFAFAQSELQAGRSAYSDTVAAIAELTPTAQRANLSVTDLYRTVQLLSALNSGPGGGVEGSVIAINNALAGQFTSLQERFNLPIAGIQAAVKAGVPALQAINDALAKEGVTMDLVTAKSKTVANQQKILFDTLAKLGADSGGKEGLDLYTTALVGLNKALQSGAVKEFASGLRDLLAVFISGNAFSDAAITMRKELYLVLYAFNELVEGVSLGKLSLAKPLADMRAGIVADEGKLRQAIQDSVGKPVADELSGKGGGPLATAKVEGYGKDLVEAFARGASETQIDQLGDLSKLLPDTVKPNTQGYTDALSDLIQAMHEVEQTGNISETTLYKLNSVFGAQTAQVANLIVQQGRLNAARANQVDADNKATQAEKALADAQKSAADDIKIYQDAVNDDIKIQKDHRQAAEDAQEEIQNNIGAIQDQAAASAKAGQQQLDGLQQGLDDFQQAASQHAAAFQAQAAAAQAQLSAASQQRQNDQALLNAALSGELEYEEQILDGLTDEQRARAAVWQAEIDGQRRAKEGANQKVTDLSRAAHKEDRDALHEIDALRSSGHEKEARAAERALAAKQKQRAAAMTLAQADAAVANDEFDAAQDKVKKEGQQQDIKDAQAEKAAQANLTRIQDAAKAQADADKAAIDAQQDRIKGVQAEQKAEQQRYQDRIDHLNDDLKTAKANAKVQDGIDQDRIDYANELLTKTQTYWDTQIDGLKTTATDLHNQSVDMKGIADNAERAYSAEQKRYDLYKNNPPGSPGGPPKPLPVGPTGNSPYDETPPSPPVAPTPSQQTPAGQARGAAAGLPPLIDGQRYPKPPEDYHTEYDQAGYRWYVPDGHTLSEYNQLGGNGSNKAPLSPVSAATGGSGPQYQRAAGFGGEPSLSAFGAGKATPVGNAGSRQTTIHINLPNVTDLGDPAQRAIIWREIEREWDDVERGGHVKREVG